jgi:hypothetical protein
MVGAMVEMMAVKMADYWLADKMDSYSVAGKACNSVAMWG